MSRKGSGKGKKEKPKPPKVQIKELTEQNALLNEELISLKNQHEELSNKLTCTIIKLFEGISKRDFNIKETTNPLDIPTDTLINIVGKMIVKKRISDMSVEARVEELETRVTKMSMDIARMTKKTMAYENGLQDLLICGNMEDVKDKVYQLQLIAGQEFHTFAAEETLSLQSRSPTPKFITQDSVSSSSSPIPNGLSRSLSPRSVISAGMGNGSRPQSAMIRIEEEAIRLNLTRPATRLPGDTALKNMHRDLRLLTMKELSLEKPSGADWRMLAERVGIPPDTTTYWSSLKLECPMGRVMAEWGESSSATVRMLHRHLVSPQMRCTLLAKRIADFYEVD